MSKTKKATKTRKHRASCQSKSSDLVAGLHQISMVVGAKLGKTPVYYFKQLSHIAKSGCSVQLACAEMTKKRNLTEDLRVLRDNIRRGDSRVVPQGTALCILR